MKGNKNYYQYLIEIVAVFLSLLVLAPLIFPILISLKSSSEAAQLDFSLPASWHFENYVAVFKTSHFITGFGNSVFFAVCALILQLSVSSLTAFILQRRNDKISKALYNYIVFGLIPGGFLIPTILVMSSLRLYGTRIGFLLIGLSIGTPLLVFLMTGFLKTIPRQIDESAVIDGSGVIRLFYAVIFPQLLPILATCSILIFMSSWNDFYGPLIWLPKTSQQPLTMTIFNFNSIYGTQWELLFADLIICSIPILLFYVFAQRYIVEGMTAGAMKG